MNREARDDAVAKSGAHEAERLLVQEVLRRSAAALDVFATYLARVPGIVAVHRSHSSVPVLDQDVPDLVQDCLSLIWRKLPEFEGRASLSTWIFRLCSYELCNGFRRIARQRLSKALPLERAQAVPERGRASSEQLVLDFDLRAGLEHLSAPQQRIVHLHHCDGRSMEEIAGQMGLRVSQVKAHYYRALQRLHDYLQGRDWEHDGP